ncbi:MAG: homoserine kinase [Chloroflexi bacterium]|nr:homoserine kinase [Chloroflexota bacterium]
MVLIEAPASSGNLGSGFDALSLALDICLRVRAEPADRVSVRTAGHGEGQLATDASNLVYQAVCCVYASTGRSAPMLAIGCENPIPLSRGMGSSSAAIIAGLMLGNALQDNPLSVDDLLVLGTEMEGHPDNVSACLLGGVQVSIERRGRILHSRVPVALELRAVLFIPDFAMDTHQARRLLPRQVGLGDAVFNLGRSALLVAALANGQRELIGASMEDRLHQGPRSALFPAMPVMLEAALEAGAVGACLSGAGSTILTLVDGDAAPVDEALRRCAAAYGVGGQTRIAAIRPMGAQVLTT